MHAVEFPGGHTQTQTQQRLASALCCWPMQFYKENATCIARPAQPASSMALYLYLQMLLAFTYSAPRSCGHMTLFVSHKLLHQFHSAACPGDRSIALCGCMPRLCVGCAMRRKSYLALYPSQHQQKGWRRLGCWLAGWLDRWMDRTGRRTNEPQTRPPAAHRHRRACYPVPPPVSLT